MYSCVPLSEFINSHAIIATVHKKGSLTIEAFYMDRYLECFIVGDLTFVFDILMLEFLIKTNEMGGHVVCMRERRGVCRVLVGKREGKRPFLRPRCRW